ncbi:MAG: hypothetical protein ACE5PV_11815 [Candidatus Poribacteria bacterium]
MSTEETKDDLEREEKIPPYFDRYVASELRALGQRIVDLKAIMDERFTHIDERFVALKESMDERFLALKESMDERFAHIEARFAQVDRRFDESKEDVNQRFDKLESTLKWAVGLLAGLFVPVIAGILAIIIKMFFSGKFSP